MQLLKDRIRKDGKIKEGNVLKVDSFLSHQMDVKSASHVLQQKYLMFLLYLLRRHRPRILPEMCTLQK